MSLLSKDYISIADLPLNDYFISFPTSELDKSPLHQLLPTISAARSNFAIYDKKDELYLVKKEVFEALKGEKYFAGALCVTTDADTGEGLKLVIYTKNIKPICKSCKSADIEIYLTKQEMSEKLMDLKIDPNKIEFQEKQDWITSDEQTR